MKVVTVKRYPITAKGKIDKSFGEPKVVREDMLVHDAYVDEINSATQYHGKIALVDEEKTAAYYKECEERNAQLEESKKIKQALAASVLKEASEASISGIAEKQRRPRKKKETQE